jgi:hypothetical protein
MEKRITNPHAPIEIREMLQDVLPELRNDDEEVVGPSQRTRSRSRMRQDINEEESVGEVPSANKIRILILTQ